MKIMWVPAYFLAFAMFAPNVVAQPQQHAPTVDVCRADVAVWWSDDVVDQYEESENELANGGKYKPNPAGDLSIQEATARLKEMIDCKKVDPNDSLAYSGAFEFYTELVMERYRQFVIRHGLGDEFLKEDAEGVR